jgi:3-deoxy-7-phosphoheptulonate synthase
MNTVISAKHLPSDLHVGENPAQNGLRSRHDVPSGASGQLTVVGTHLLTEATCSMSAGAHTSALATTPTTDDTVVPTPAELRRSLPASDNGQKLIPHARQTIRDILAGVDHRLCVVVGPCSIHDPVAALEYAYRLTELADRLSDTLYLVMRVYCEKPRTATGWKGLINDPRLDGSCRLAEGVTIARQLLRDIAELGLPAATEALDPIVQWYLHDLITWTAIGARTVASQTHREMASGLHSPLGFENGPDGDVTVALNAMRASAQPQRILGINDAGHAAIIRTTGNTNSHIVLRGGATPNYEAAHVAACERLLVAHGCKPNIMIDCSHGNAQKQPERQRRVMQDVVKQILDGNTSIKALMLESHLHAGNQPLTGNAAELRYGVSITDPCIDWQTTERSLCDLRAQLRSVLPGRGSANARVQVTEVAVPATRPLRRQLIDRPINLCTSTMPAFGLHDCLTLAAAAGYQGVELRVHDNYHVALPQLDDHCVDIKRHIETHQLDLRVYNTYYGVTDTRAVDRLIRICQRTGVKFFRVTVPVAGAAHVRTQSSEKAVVPSYEQHGRPKEVLRSVKAELQRLAKRTKAAGVCALVEIHWGTVMSSFSSAYYLAGDLDPDAVAITLDPANMIIEGKEDWVYGIRLLHEHIANVHIKNVSWLKHADGWKWRWDGLQEGMVEWPHLLCVLAETGYSSMFAMEDFRVPHSFNEALHHLHTLREETRVLFQHTEARHAA